VCGLTRGPGSGVGDCYNYDYDGPGSGLYKVHPPRSSSRVWGVGGRGHGLCLRR